jgi:hypothetical protein
MSNRLTRITRALAACSVIALALAGVLAVPLTYCHS